jgi:hypothetical protein
MGLFDAIKDLIGGTGVADLAEQVGLGDHLAGVTDAIQQPVEELGALQEDVGQAVAPIEDATNLLP